MPLYKAVQVPPMRCDTSTMPSSIFSKCFFRSGSIMTLNIILIFSIISQTLSKALWCSHQESNLDLGLRSPLFYPLNYGGKHNLRLTVITILNSTQCRKFGIDQNKKT